MLLVFVPRFEQYREQVRRREAEQHLQVELRRNEENARQQAEERYRIEEEEGLRVERQAVEARTAEVAHFPKIQELEQKQKLEEDSSHAEMRQRLQRLDSNPTVLTEQELQNMSKSEKQVALLQAREELEALEQQVFISISLYV